MPLLSDTREHALIAYLVERAEKNDKRHLGYLGRTAIQKLIYFLRVAGIPMRYNFVIHFYGPYCEDVGLDIESLRVDGFISDKSRTDKYSNYVASQSTHELLQSYDDFLSKYEEIVDRVIDTFADLSPSDLEQVATLDYLYRLEIATSNTDPLKARVLDRFIEIKKDKYDRNQISTWYDLMESSGIFSSLQS